MPRKTTAVLGIPVELMTMEQVVDATLCMIDEYQEDHHPRYIATVNVDFLVNAHSWYSFRPRHYELLQALREADLVTADGMPIIWLSHQLGTPIPERVTGADLVPHLAAAACHHNKSVFFLGGRQDVADKAVANLQQAYPGLKIAGTACPWIDMPGPEISDSDRSLVDTINRAQPDILFLNLGNPKQELWFRHVYQELQVPIAVGVGGALSFVAGTIPRAPQALQRLGLEWLYRLYQEPLRLWKRYLLGFLKISLIAGPLLAYHRASKLKARWTNNSSTPEKPFSNSHHTHNLIKLPAFLSDGNAPNLADYIGRGSSPNLTILDFSPVQHITATGIAALLNGWLYAHERGKSLYGIELRPHARRLLKLHRTWDFLSPYMYDTLQDILPNTQCESSP